MSFQTDGAWPWSGPGAALPGALGRPADISFFFPSTVKAVRSMADPVPRRRVSMLILSARGPKSSMPRGIRDEEIIVITLKTLPI